MKNQKQFVLKKLLEDNFITRNHCLRNYISRLGAIMCDFKNEGLKFNTMYNEGDYVYYVSRQSGKLKQLLKKYGK